MQINWKSKSPGVFYVPRKETNVGFKERTNFRANPFAHSRISYNYNKKSIGAGLLDEFGKPGGCRKTSNEDKCIGSLHLEDYMLSKEIAYETKRTICPKQAGAKYASNRQYLQGKRRLYNQNLSINKKSEFTNGSVICEDGVEKNIIRYSKPSNMKYLTQGAVTASSKTLRYKLNEIAKNTKYEESSSIPMALSYNTPRVKKDMSKSMQECSIKRKGALNIKKYLC